MNIDPALFPKALGYAVLLPLFSFAAIFLFGPRMGKAGKAAGLVATAAIFTSAVLSFFCLFMWLRGHEMADLIGHHDHEEHASRAAELGGQFVAMLGSGPECHPDGPRIPHAYAGDYYTLGEFGNLRLTIGYYIDTLTIVMFCMVTLIATLIHIYATGYMHDELHDITDHEVTLMSGGHLKRPGRYSRFFQYLSLFCFSMLGLVLSGNIAMVFVFWELVGICSYFLIGFYVERKSASTAANKAFIVNRVGDFGMIIGLMVLWTYLGTFNFGDVKRDGVVQPGLFSQVRPFHEHHAFQLQVPEAMVVAGAPEDEVASVLREHTREAAKSEISSRVESEWRSKGYGYWLLVLAGLGIFCGCVGKSAQFPLHVWLPDAMEGPTPVSALVHSATMVAAGVYLVGRFYPVFAPEVLLVIACTGCVTLFMAATIAITANDIKRVLAYSTVSQLGYMMLGLGVGGWVAGLLHLITHAFFKSLLFMCSGSVIHAVHTNDMRYMGGLRKKMPVTAYTMLVGCLAIAGVSVPYVIGFSGYYSKDAILEQTYSFMGRNNSVFGGLFFGAAAGGAAITAFYMFRMWYMTFVGKPRDHHRYDHAHESPKAMYVPLVILAVFATAVAWSATDGVLGSLIGVAITGAIAWRCRPQAGHDAHGHGDHGHGHAGHGAHSHDSHGHDHDEGHHGPETLSPRIVYLPLILSVVVFLISLIWLPNKTIVLRNLLENARPAGVEASMTGSLIALTWPAEADSHASPIVLVVTAMATGAAWLGIGLATIMYGFGKLNPDDVRKQFEAVYRFLVHKWWFDELYDFLFVRPTHVIARMAASIDRGVIDWLIDNSAKLTKWISVTWDYIADRTIVDGTVNLIARWTYSIGVSLRQVQTGRVRQYVMFIVIGMIAIFVLISFFWSPTLAR